MSSPSTSSNQQFSMESLVGKELLIKSGSPKEPTKEIFKGKKLCGLYFSASWCPPCKAFSPHLSAFYNTLKGGSATKNDLEMIYVSSDRAIQDFNTYYGTMPFCAVPSDQGSADIKNTLARTLGISGIPTLIIIDATTGELVSVAGRNEISAIKQVQDLTECQNLVKEWMDTERKPLSDASSALSGGGGGGGPIMNFIMFFVKRPMFIFGLLYVYKMANKKMESWLSPQQQAASGAGGSNNPLQPNQNNIPKIPEEEESEF